jgi:hypothetical protein
MYTIIDFSRCCYDGYRETRGVDHQMTEEILKSTGKLFLKLCRWQYDMSVYVQILTL